LSAPSPRSKDDSIYYEEWRRFGKILEAYISENRDLLEHESFDIILGFSRGGIILAFAFACLLKDGQNTVYSKPSKASVRPIPRGLAYKKTDRCFVMNQAASRAEIEDIIKNLRDDLEDYSRTFEIKTPLNVLIMDDNLTGATRVQFLEDILDDMKPVVGRHKTLAYVRHKVFPEEEIPTIRGFPPRKNIFVMPWHIFHKKGILKFPNEDLNLVNLEDIDLKFCFELNERLNSLDEFINTLKKKKYYRFKNRYGQDIIINGASEFLLRLSEGFIEFRYRPRLLYPPKGCLKIEMEDNEDNDHCGTYDISDDPTFLPLCLLIDEKKITGATCLACPILNCNKELFDCALAYGKSSKKIKISLKSDRNEIVKLKGDIENWLEKTGINLIKS
jgi:hypothetical protein